MPIDINLAMAALYQLFQLINQDKIEKFEKQWKKDHAKIIKCFESGNADCINRFIAKYQSL